MSADKDWEEFNSFSNTTDYEEGSHYLDDGSTLYINDDGSGTYYGSDGSTGYLNSDGSGTYYGSNGSTGYLNSDGSGTYYGSDGSTGYLNSDGSGIFYPEEGESIEYYSDDESTSEDTTDGVGALGTMIGLGLVGVMAHKANQQNERIRIEEEQARREREREFKKELKRQKAKEKRARRFSFYKRHWKGLIIGILAVVLLLTGGGFFLYYSSLIPMNYSAEEVQGMDYNELKEALRDSGYWSVYGTGEEDLDYDKLDQEGNIVTMTVNGDSDFKKGKRYSKDAKIRIRYHSAKQINPPATAKELKGKNYKKVVSAFKKQGFGNIKTKGEKDSFVVKWMNDDGDVKSVTVDNDEDYSTSSKYRVDDEIVIVYHKK